MSSIPEQFDIRSPNPAASVDDGPSTVFYEGMDIHHASELSSPILGCYSKSDGTQDHATIGPLNIAQNNNALDQHLLAMSSLTASSSIDINMLQFLSVVAKCLPFEELRQRLHNLFWSYKSEHCQTSLFAT